MNDLDKMHENTEKKCLHIGFIEYCIRLQDLILTKEPNINGLFEIDSAEIIKIKDDFDVDKLYNELNKKK